MFLSRLQLFFFKAQLVGLPNQTESMLKRRNWKFNEFDIFYKKGPAGVAIWTVTCDKQANTWIYGGD